MPERSCIPTSYHRGIRPPLPTSLYSHHHLNYHHYTTATITITTLGLTCWDDGEGARRTLLPDAVEGPAEQCAVVQVALWGVAGDRHKLLRDRKVKGNSAAGDDVSEEVSC